MSTLNLTSDFDWFARDAGGALALFSTGGAGFLPEAVTEFHVMHATVAGGIEYPHWGTEQLWDDVAVLGLYVYDWAVDARHYARAAQPQGAAEPAFADMIGRIEALPELRGTFASLTQISTLDAFLPRERPRMPS